MVTEHSEIFQMLFGSSACAHAQKHGILQGSWMGQLLLFLILAVSTVDLGEARMFPNLFQNGGKGSKSSFGVQDKVTEWSEQLPSAREMEVEMDERTVQRFLMQSASDPYEDEDPVITAFYTIPEVVRLGSSYTMVAEVEGVSNGQSIMMNIVGSDGFNVTVPCYSPIDTAGFPHGKGKCAKAVPGNPLASNNGMRDRLTVWIQEGFRTLAKSNLVLRTTSATPPSL